MVSLVQRIYKPKNGRVFFSGVFFFWVCVWKTKRVSNFQVVLSEGFFETWDFLPRSLEAEKKVKAPAKDDRNLASFFC